MLAEEREKQEARQTVIHKIAKNPQSTHFPEKGFPFHPHKTVVISLLPYAVVDSSLCFTT
ncbi:hypothetical protein JS565_21100 [Salmonella enterica subsp. enterica serovar Senftenberg]|nr:hypothetical protein [Salmonella enterica subsp. enterica serovar Senftenberg]